MCSTFGKATSIFMVVRQAFQSISLPAARNSNSAANASSGSATGPTTAERLMASTAALAIRIGLIPFFLGLAVVIPLLGHATWHLYRKVIAPDPYQSSATPRPPREKRPAA